MNEPMAQGQLDEVGCLFIDTLPQDGYTKADTALTFDWSNRGSEEDRLAAIAKTMKGALGIEGVTLTDSLVTMVNLPGWQTCLVVSPVDLLRQQGIDPEELKNTDYCRLVAVLMNNLVGITPTDYITECSRGESARLEDETLKAWLAIPTTQEKEQPLVVRRMAVNPAIWFDHEGAVYSLAAIHTPALFANLPTTNKVKKVLPGDLVVATSLLIGESHLVDQLGVGTCPNIDVPGTELHQDGSWFICPYLYADGLKTWLDGCFSNEVNEYFGSLGCAGE